MADILPFPTERTRPSEATLLDARSRVTCAPVGLADLSPETRAAVLALATMEPSKTPVVYDGVEDWIDPAFAAYLRDGGCPE